MRRLSLQLAGSCVALISALPLAGPARAQYSEFERESLRNRHAWWRI